MNNCKQKKIFHIGAWNRNIGDWVALYNMHRMLEAEALKKEISVSFYPIDSQRGVFHKSLVDQINEEGDMLLVGGGGMIFNRPHDESVSGWAFNITEELLESISVPMVVYAIGYNKFFFDKNKWPESMASHLRNTQKKSLFFSVRNKGSVDNLVKEFNLIESDISIVPDPGMRLYDRHIDIPGIDKNKKIIILNWAGDRPEERFSSPWKENRKYYIDNLRNALIEVVKEENCQLLYVPHLEDVDTPFFEEFNHGFEKDSIVNLHKELPHLYPPAGEMLYYNVPFFTNIYRQADLTLGMRGHSCIFSFGAGTSFIPIGSHNKVMYFANDLGLGNYSIRMISKEDDTKSSMKETIVNCLHDKNYNKSIQNMISVQYGLLDKANSQIIDILNNNYE